MTDAELDDLFAQARKVTPDDNGAADRFLMGWTQPHARKRPVRWPPLLAAAAVLGGLLVLRPAPELPASAAYDAYQSAWGEGW